MTLDALLADPAVRARLAAALGAEVGASARRPWWSRYRQFLAGLASGSVVVLAFLLPSLQDQWDRRQLQQTIEQYAAIGHTLFDQGLYESAESTFAKALELSEGRRIDLLEAQLRAHVERVNEDPNWRGSIPDSLTESDFIYLLELQKGPDRQRERAATLAAFGAYLASKNRPADAGQRLRQAIALDPRNVAALVNLGNLHAEAGDTASAERQYRAALAAAPRDANVLYNLVTLLQEGGRCIEAEPLLRSRLESAPGDPVITSLIEACAKEPGGAPRAKTP